MFDCMSLLYIPEARKCHLVVFADIKSIDDYSSILDFSILKQNLYFSRQEFTQSDEIFYIAPNFFEDDQLDAMFVQVLPEEVTIYEI